ncbi:MAG: PSD1 and planctomycete cytochrome C domain-containing protein [Fuerstiella sp.]
MPCRLVMHLAILFAPALILAEETPSQVTAESPRFETHVRLILKTHCFQCHGEEQEVSGGLDLRLVRLMATGGESGTAIVAGKPDESLLMQRIQDGEMPPGEGKQLTAADTKLIHDWIAAGAKTVRAEPESLDDSMLITEEERSHWSFQPIHSPPVPEVTGESKVNNPIDAFVLEKLESGGFIFSPTATPATRIRRAYMDLLGLPPTPAAVEAFEAASSKNATNKDATVAWAQLINELLQSPHYGERWARHWLDIAGYSDSEGYTDVDTERAHAWRYRDYVIQSFNEDKPYDTFITEQLAGDELITSPINNLSTADAKLLAATGFLRMAPDGTGDAVPDKALAQNDTVADTLKIVSSSLMAMTVGCAQCHDHRYDPISQADYYRMRAIFEPAFDCEQWKTPAQRRVSLYTDADRKLAAEVEANAKKLDAEHKAKQTEYINATFEKQLAKLPEDIHELARSAHATTAKQRSAEQTAILKKHPSLNVTAGSLYLYDKKADDELKKMADAAKKLRGTKPKENFVRALLETPGRLPTTKLFYRGDHEQPKQELSPAGLTVVSLTTDLQQIPSNSADMPSSGRRLAFARRLTNANHPLTARVLVNRVWRHHFGRGLVETPSDFGMLGQTPTHPELLDWLASEFISSGWSIKHLHRLILTSTTWQQSVRTIEKLEAADPDNELYGGFRLIRLDAEVVRDSMLAIAGKLNTKAFGPPVPVMADQVGRIVVGKENLNAGRPGAVIDLKGEQFRRSIYIQTRRSRPLSVLDTFDRPAMAPNCDMRRPSTNSTQSLLMMNSDLVIEYSRYLAERLQTDSPDNTALQIQNAWKLIYSRNANESEISMAEHFLQQQTDALAATTAYKPDGKTPPKRSAPQEAMAILCQMLLSSNEFLYLD